MRYRAKSRPVRGITSRVFGFLHANYMVIKNTDLWRAERYHDGNWVENARPRPQDFGLCLPDRVIVCPNKIKGELLRAQSISKLSCDKVIMCPQNKHFAT